MLMKMFGITSNIMSLTGIAIAIGVLVDAAIVVTENVLRQCEKAEEEKGARLTRKETWPPSVRSDALGLNRPFRSSRSLYRCGSPCHRI